MAQYGSEAARAYLVLARGDTAAALRHFKALPHDVWWSTLERVTEGQILARRGMDAEAMKVLDHAFSPEWTGPVRVLATLETGRSAERLGQEKRAVADHQFVINAWRHADPELEPYVREARAGLQRLVSEPRR